MTAFVEKIYIYPIKSFDGVEVQSRLLTHGGALLTDREFVLVDSEKVPLGSSISNVVQQSVNGKNEPTLFSIRANFEDFRDRSPTEPITSVVLTDQSGSKVKFDLEKDFLAIDAWVSKLTNRKVRLERNILGGFPDSKTGTGPTWIAQATLETVASWMRAADKRPVTADEVRRRLRVNIVVGGVPAFWEDHLIPAHSNSTFVPFTVGVCDFEGTGPCLRCPVPSRDPENGVISKSFQRTIITQREANLPAWITQQAFQHGFYYLSSKSRGAPTLEPKLAGNSAIIKVGDKISL